MGLTAAILLLVLGIGLLLLEFLVVPGVTIAGIGGLICIVGSIIYAYATFGPSTGNYFLGVSVFIFIGTIAMALKGNVWSKAMLKEDIVGRVNAFETDDEVKPGDEGITFTRLNPMGKVLLNEKTYEAKSITGYLPEKSAVKVIKITGNTIIVKPIINQT